MKPKGQRVTSAGATANKTVKNKNNKVNTLAAFVATSNIPASLIRATVRQFGGWESFKESASDVCRGGIDGGFHGFIYTRDTEAFTKRNRVAIAELASAQASDFGTSVTEMIQGFGCFRNEKPSDEEIGRALYAGKSVEDGVGVLNALAWYAGEEVSRSYCDLVGEND